MIIDFRYTMNEIESFLNEYPDPIKKYEELLNTLTFVVREDDESLRAVVNISDDGHYDAARIYFHWFGDRPAHKLARTVLSVQSILDDDIYVSYVNNDDPIKMKFADWLGWEPIYSNDRQTVFRKDLRCHLD